MKLYVEEHDMPPNCAECMAECHYENYYGDEYGFFCPFGYKAYTEKTRDAKRLDDCPLVSVPTHGRLIDADALCNRLEKAGKIKPYLESGLNVAISFSLTAPTIIPASEEGE